MYYVSNGLFSKQSTPKINTAMKIFFSDLKKVVHFGTSH